MNLTNFPTGRAFSAQTRIPFYLLVFVWWLLFSNNLHAERSLQGVLINGTTSNPVAGQKVELLVLGEGMQNNSETVTNANGEFRFSLAEGVQTPHWLLRSIYHGVNYNLTVTPDQNLAAPVKLMIYEPTDKLQGIRVSLPLMLAQASGNSLYVQQQYLFVNETVPPKTLVLPGGTFLFDTPPSELISELNVSVVGTAGIPLPQNPSPRKEGGYAMNYPMKPGANEIRISYKVNYSTNQREFKHRLYYGVGKTKVLILPAELQVSGQGLKATGPDSRTQAASYELASVGKDASLALKISGDAPQVSEEGAKGSAGVTEQESDNTSGIQVVRLPNSIFENKTYILAGFGVLFVIAILVALRQKAQTNSNLRSRR